MASIVKIDLTELLRKVGNTAEIEEAEKTSYPEDNLVLSQPVEIKAQLLNTGSSVLLKGKVKTEAVLTCSRCLKEYRQPLSVKIEEEYSKTPPLPKKAKEVELKAEDFVYSIEKDNTLDLSEAIRQNLLLALPIKPLCEEDNHATTKKETF